MTGTAAGRTRTRSAKRIPARRRKVARRRNRVLRVSAERAQDFLAAAVSDEWPADPPEPDDAVAPDNQAEWRDFDDDELLFDNDRVLLDPRPAWLASPKVTIYVDNGALNYQVHVQIPDVRDYADSSAALHDNWVKIARALINGVPNCLLTRTPLDALHALSPVTDVTTRRTGQQVLARYQGQWSRESDEVIFTPFGPAPLWFFGVFREPSKPALWADVEKLGCALVAGAREHISQSRKNIPTDMINEILPWPSIKPESISRQHGKALMAVVDHPEVVARHRSRWPLTSPDALLDDLGILAAESQGRSIPTATLALVGAFDPTVNPRLRDQARRRGDE